MLESTEHQSRSALDASMDDIDELVLAFPVYLLLTLAARRPA